MIVLHTKTITIFTTSIAESTTATPTTKAVVQAYSADYSVVA